MGECADEQQAPERLDRNQQEATLMRGSRNNVPPDLPPGF